MGYSRVVRYQEKLRQAEKPFLTVLPDGKINVALVYPNSYETGMANLGVHTIYQRFNSLTGVSCQRFFLPPHGTEAGCEMLSIETNKTLRKFDIIAFSFSFELDYLNIPAILKAAAIPLKVEERSANSGGTYGESPLVIAGGIAVTMNPLPLLPFFDVLVIGDGEEVPRLLMDVYEEYRYDREELLEQLGRLPGCLIPAHGIKPVAKLHFDMTKQPARSMVVTPYCAFPDMRLLEVERGCRFNCHFCASSKLNHPYRAADFEVLRELIKPGGHYGLVGSSLCSHPQLKKLLELVIETGSTAGVSSLRLDALDEETLQLLVRAGVRTVTLAPEAGTERLRLLLNKNFMDSAIHTAVERVVAAGFKSLKLYFMYGLPTETEDDLLALIDLIHAIHRTAGSRRPGSGRYPLELSLNIAPFVPKPWTPLERVAMLLPDQLKQRQQFLKKELRRIENTTVAFYPVREAVIQAMLARGDERAAEIIVAAGSGRISTAGLRCFIEQQAVVFNRDSESF